MPKVKENSTAVTVGYEAKLRQVANLLRGSRDAADYKDVGFGLVFFKPV